MKVKRAGIGTKILVLVLLVAAVTALLSMLNSCASGVSVVNIDNGFGAGYQAHLINNMEV